MREEVDVRKTTCFTSRATIVYSDWVLLELLKLSQTRYTSGICLPWGFGKFHGYGSVMTASLRALCKLTNLQHNV